MSTIYYGPGVKASDPRDVPSGERRRQGLNLHAPKRNLLSKQAPPPSIGWLLQKHQLPGKESNLPLGGWAYLPSVVIPVSHHLTSGVDALYPERDLNP